MCRHISLLYLKILKYVWFVIVGQLSIQAKQWPGRQWQGECRWQLWHWWWQWCHSRSHGKILQWANNSILLWMLCFSCLEYMPHLSCPWINFRIFLEWLIGRLANENAFVINMYLWLALKNSCQGKNTKDIPLFKSYLIFYLFLSIDKWSTIQCKATVSRIFMHRAGL